MKPLFTCLPIILSVSLALAGCAATGGPQPAVDAAAAEPGPACISSPRIDHTEVVDDHTILFVMSDRTVYKNTLVAPCLGLTFGNNGFLYNSTPGGGDICGNMQSIRMIGNGQICLLGAFTTVRKRKRT